jgi:Zn-dependent oligopeptidase
MLENWCWKPEALRRMSAHHATGEPIPPALLDALLASRNANSAVLNMRQIVLGSFDQAIPHKHSIA